MDPVEISHIAQGDVPSRRAPIVHPFAHKSGGFPSPQRSLSSSRMEVIPERSDTSNQEHREQEKARPDSAESSTLSDEEESNQRSAESGVSTSKSLGHVNSSRDMQMAPSSSRLETLVSNAGEGELQGFADQFRALVDQVSRELEESRISENDSRELHTPPLHHVLDTHTPYMTVDEFGNEVPTEVPIAVLGSVIKRMPTIESVGSRELASLRSATLIGGSGAGGNGIGSASIVTSSSASSRSRPPTGATMASLNDAASASLASASQPPSRSNSIHRLRPSSELGELVRDALRARGQTRPFPPSSSARPGSGGSMSGSGSGCTGAGSGSGSGTGSGSGSGSGESAVAVSHGPGPSSLARSRSNSLGPNEILPPVTEHGELGREDSDLPPLRPPRRLGGTDVPGVVGEMGEALRTEWTRSWTSSAPSATSTTYFTAGTPGSLVVTNSGSGSYGGDTGTGSSGGGGPQMKT